jgi:4-hydroxy-2-oxoheptanedioate aldolase
MRPNRVKGLWREGKDVRAAWTLTGDPLTAEILANSGFDAVLIDMQHGFTIGPERAGALLQAISTTEAVPLVRVPWNEPFHIQYVLDAGAYGVIVPLVNTPEEAAKAAGACRYPPLGFRSIGPNRVEYYAGSGYVEHANEEIICLVMIEHIDAVGRIDEIARVPGLDGFFIGPGDLAMSLGLPPGAGAADSRFQEACQRVLDAARANGLVAGIAPFSAEDARRQVDKGFAFCPFGADWTFLVEGAEAALRVFGGPEIPG